MNETAILRIFLSFLVAGTWISAASFLSERLGTKIGGLIANLPSNILVSLLFMALGRGSQYAAGAASAVPLGMTIDTLFVLAFMAGLRWGLGPALGLSLGLWAALAALAMLLPPLPLLPSLILYIVVCAAAFALAEWVMKVRAMAASPVRFKLSLLAIRALFAGTVVAGAVAASQLAPPYLTGIIATFPAVLSSTLVILSRGRGAEFARATGKVLLVSSSNINVYALAAAVFFPLIGPWLGSLLAFGLAATFVWLLLPIVRKFS